MRTFAITAERPAQGLLESRDALLESRPRSPRPNPSASPRIRRPPLPPTPLPKAPSKLDMISRPIEAESKAVAFRTADGATPPEPISAAPSANRPHPCKSKVAEASHVCPLLGDEGLAELICRINADSRGDRQNVPSPALLIPAPPPPGTPKKLVASAVVPPRRDPIQYDYPLAQSVHLRSCIGHYHVDRHESDQPRQDDRVALRALGSRG